MEVSRSWEMQYYARWILFRLIYNISSLLLKRQYLCVFLLKRQYLCVCKKKVNKLLLIFIWTRGVNKACQCPFMEQNTWGKWVVGKVRFVFIPGWLSCFWAWSSVCQWKKCFASREASPPEEIRMVLVPSPNCMSSPLPNNTKECQSSFQDKSLCGYFSKP